MVFLAWVDTGPLHYYPGFLPMKQEWELRDP